VFLRWVGALPVFPSGVAERGAALPAQVFLFKAREIRAVLFPAPMARRRKCNPVMRRLGCIGICTKSPGFCFRLKVLADVKPIIHIIIPIMS